MPRVYLSPSTQEFNPYIGGGNEEYYMNLIADAMEPYLRSSGILFARNNPAMTTESSVMQANQGNYDQYLSLHSASSPGDEAGMRQGCNLFYHPASQRGQRFADIAADNFKAVYPYEWLIKKVPASSLWEVSSSRAPAVRIELAYHDNDDDANWIRQNISEIAANIVLSITQCFDIPFIAPQPMQKGMVTLASGWLNIRRRPSLDAQVIARAWNDSPILVFGEWQGWYIVNYRGTIGYADARYIRLF